MRKFFLLVFFLLTFLNPKAQVRSPYDDGVAGLGQLLKRLQTTASALHTGAHPDDEDSALLALLARGKGARTAYLSLNRGEGGQNRIGGELFEALGIIRTEELLQARRLDGAEQFFTRVVDFGFSKTLTESAKIWDERIVLADLVRAIRKYRPLVVISRFTGTPADGHGQHQLAGYLTIKAFRLASDPNQFPEQIQEGLLPWQPLKLYVSQGFFVDPRNQPTLLLNAGEYSFLHGRSYYEIAIEGRSKHRSQEMGSLELRGPQTVGLRLVDSLVSTSSEKDIFDGIDTSITGISKITGENRKEFVEKLRLLEAIAKQALEKYNPFAPYQLTPILARGIQICKEAEILTENPDAKMLVKIKKEEFIQSLLLANGIQIDALSDIETPIAEESFQIAVRIFIAKNSPLKFEKVEIKAPENWKIEPIEEPFRKSENLALDREKPFYVKFFRASVPKNEKPTQPYWLELPRKGYIFDWSKTNYPLLPFSPPILKAEITVKINRVSFKVEKEVEYRFADPTEGEMRRHLQVIPRLHLQITPDLLIVPTSSKANYILKVRVVNNSDDTVQGTLRLKASEEFTITPKEIRFSLRGKQQDFFNFSLQSKAKAGSYQVIAEALTEYGVFDQTMFKVSYPYIQTHRYYKTAQTNVKVFDLKIIPVRVGYIMGSGDDVPEAIRRMGLEVELLDGETLSTEDLSKYDVIVVGIRASETRPDFQANNDRLLNYIRNGGVLIVQYQQQDYTRKNLTPFPAKIEPVIRNGQRFSNLRVTDENAPVRILVPDHPIFNYPNKITDEDWKDWVQERNLYCFTEFDSRYIPLLESHDEGEPENFGGMLYAEIGKGKYIYTAYTWFRQLPAGVPGAYRIFANMLSLPKAK